MSLRKREEWSRFYLDDSGIREKNLADKESTHYEACVYFKSFFGDDEINLKVELDIKEFDRIFLPVQTCGIIHEYSDHILCKADLRCRKLEELFASKLKALLQRRHSPDLYDFVYSVFFQKIIDIRRGELITTFLKKTEFRPQIENNIDVLCRKHSGLRRSYIVPEFLYKPLYDSKHRLNVLLTGTSGHRFFEQKEISEPPPFLLTWGKENMIVSQHV